jgi:hypothetical protein
VATGIDLQIDAVEHCNWPASRRVTVGDAAKTDADAPNQSHGGQSTGDGRPMPAWNRVAGQSRAELVVFGFSS